MSMNAHRPNSEPIQQVEPVSPPPRTWVLIRQPNGGRDRWMAIAEPDRYWAPRTVAPLPGWLFLFGFQLDADGELQQYPSTLYVRPAGRDWEMVPYVPMDPPGPALAEKNERLLRQRLHAD
jgi:hypothetical protein